MKNLHGPIIAAIVNVIVGAIATWTVKEFGSEAMLKHIYSFISYMIPIVMGLAGFFIFRFIQRRRTLEQRRRTLEHWLCDQDSHTEPDTNLESKINRLVAGQLHVLGNRIDELRQEIFRQQSKTQKKELHGQETHEG